MSREQDCLIYLEKDAWRLPGKSAVEFVPDELVAQAEKIEAALSEAGNQGKPIVLGLSTDWCLATTLAVASPQILRRPQVMHFQLEESIPWTAEEYVSDFIGHRSQALMVAVRHQLLADFLQALEDAGIFIIAIGPLTLLAIEQHLTPSDPWLLWQDGEFVDLVVMRQGKPFRWERSPATAKDLVRLVRLEALTQASPGPFLTCAMAEDLSQALTDEGVEFEPLESLTQLQAANLTAQSIVTGQQEPHINLRKDELGGREKFSSLGKEVVRLKIAAAVLLLGIGLAFWVRGKHYAEANQQVRTKLTTVYQDLFPEKEVPSRVGAEIDSQFKLLRGTRQPAADLPTPASADLVLQRLLQALPEKLRFRMPEIRVEQNRLYLSGEVRSNTDADQIATALREQGFLVDPPRTQRLAEKGFSVRFSARTEGTEKP